ncbi:MAG: DUF5668 domain-containing protein [Candidatus Nanoarchaeia archaeon]|nr:DUF5668 domain-containing protein [Candidatus Nanoarchaeia archaeon]
MDFGQIFWGIVLICFGIAFFISNIYGINVWHLIFTYWPVILIIIGFSILLRAYRGYKK